MVERRWSSTEYKPAMDEYLERGMASVAAHAIALPATGFLNQNGGFEYQNITKLLMAVARLANDAQSYEVITREHHLRLLLLSLSIFES